MNPLSFLAGAGVGAGLMYLLDPQLGKTRRALIRDKAVRLYHDAEDAACVLRRDLGNRAEGLLVEGRSLLRGGPVSDDTLRERVRSKIGRYVSHPGAIEVAVRDGRVTLSGPILAPEVGRLTAAVWSVRGVNGVENRLEAHQEPGNVPGLQGESLRTGELFELFQRNWSPTTRFLAGATGLGLLAFGLTQRAPTACALGTIGLGLCSCGAAGGNWTNPAAWQRGRQEAGGSRQPARQFAGTGI